MISFRKFQNFLKCTSVVILAFSGLRLSAMPQSAPAPTVDNELQTQTRLASVQRGDGKPFFATRFAAPLAAPTPVITNTNEDTPIDIDVLQNNTGITITNVITNTTLGLVSINNPAPQTIHYDPTVGLNYLAAGQIYTDTFKYVAIDTTMTYTVPVTVTVSGVNDLPIALNDTATTGENTPKDFIVLTNDYDPDTSDVITVTNLNTSGLQGTASINVDNTIHYDPGTVFDYLQQGQTANTSFQYTISDGHVGSTSSATVAVTVTGVDDPPIAVSDLGITTTTEDSATSLDVLKNDSDPENDPLSITGLLAGTAKGAVSINQNNTLDYDPTAGLNYLGQGQVYTDTFSYIVSDGVLTSTAPVSVRVTGVNDPPIALSDVATTTEDSATNINVLANDHDPDTSDTLTVTGLNTTGLQGNAIINLDNTIHYNPGTVFNYLQQGQTASTGFSYTISDGQSGTSSANVSVTITGVNDPPVAVNDNVTTGENNATNINVLSNDSDPDTGTTLTVTGLNTTVLTGTASINSNNTIHYNPGTAFDYLGVGQTGTTSFQYTIDDGHGGTASATVHITVNGVNDNPTAAADTATTSEDAATNINVLANDHDPDTSDVLTVTGLNTTGLKGTASINSNNTIHYNPGTVFNYLQQGQSASTGFSYTISDGHGGTSSANVSVTVTGVNDPPVAMNDHFYSTSNTLTVAAPGVLANDSDVDSGDRFTAKIYDLPKSPLVLNSDGSFTYVPMPDPNLDIITDTFKYQAYDGRELSQIATVTITIDTGIPQVTWLEPVQHGGQIYVPQPNEKIPLSFTATDNISISRVELFRWDAIRKVTVMIANLNHEPYFFELDSRQLNFGWNQIFIQAFDEAGNANDYQDPSKGGFFWIYRYGATLPLIAK
jgi:VCBS repeat-containing protein